VEPLSTTNHDDGLTVCSHSDSWSTGIASRSFQTAVITA
jgi:hypothetical protein